MKRKLPISLSFVVALVVAMSALGGNALANSHGRCNGPSSRYATTPVIWVQNLQAEGVQSQAASVESKAGFSHADGTLMEFAKQHTVVAPLLKPAWVDDYYCHDGKLTFWKRKLLPAGTPVVFVLPKNVTVSQVSRHGGKGLKPMPAGKSAAQANCSNPSFGKVWVKLWIKIKAKAKPKAKPKAPAVKKPVVVTPPVTQTAGCDANQTAEGMIWDVASAKCVTQTNKADNTCGNGQIMSTTGCVNIQINITCGGNVSINGSPIQSSDKNCDTTYNPPPATPPVIDICKDVDGVQTTVPQGRHTDGAGNCPLNPPPPPGSFTSTVTVTVSVTASASATANCPAGSAQATATATASGSGSGTGTGSGSSTVSQAAADQIATTNANNNAKVNAVAAATATAYANAQAAASVKCTPAPPPPTCADQGKTGTYPNCVTPPPANKPPTGTFIAPKHIYVGESYAVCVDNVTDPDGDNVAITFTATTGQLSGPVYKQSGGTAWCQNYTAPADPTQVTFYVKLDDGHGHPVTYTDNTPVISQQLPPL